MGCTQSNDKISPKNSSSDSIANRKGTGKEASTMLQHLIKEHRKEKVDSVYDINWDDNQALGSGATSTVRIAINKTTKEKFALKTIELHRLPPAVVQSLFEEVNIMRVLDHPNIIKIIETFVDFKRLYIINPKISISILKIEPRLKLKTIKPK